MVLPGKAEIPCFMTLSRSRSNSPHRVDQCPNFKSFVVLPKGTHGSEVKLRFSARSSSSRLRLGCGRVRVITRLVGVTRGLASPSRSLTRDPMVADVTKNTLARSGKVFWVVRLSTVEVRARLNLGVRGILELSVERLDAGRRRSTRVDILVGSRKFGGNHLPVPPRIT